VSKIAMMGRFATKLQWSIGCDPELLLTAGTKFVSAVGKLPGTKEKPQDVEFGKVHVDNVAGEFNTLPAFSVSEFDLSVHRMLTTMEDLVSKQGLTISDKSVGIYDEEDLTHPEARRGGCDPDFDAYSGSVNGSPPMEHVPIRCAGGHIHIGIKDLSDKDVHKLVRVLDLFVTIPMLKYEDPMRRVLYGGAGAYRKKPYGVEYRTPSNFWVFKKERREWLYRQVERAVQSFKSTQPPVTVKDIINGHDITAADKLIAEYSLEVCPQ